MVREEFNPARHSHMGILAEHADSELCHLEYHLETLGCDSALEQLRGESVDQHAVHQRLLTAKAGAFPLELRPQIVEIFARIVDEHQARIVCWICSLARLLLR